MMIRSQKPHGFTLIELLVVIAILAILVVSGIASFTSSQKRSRDIRRKNDLRQISLALESYYNDFGSYPTTVPGSGKMDGCGVDGIVTCEWGAVWSNTTPNPDTIYMLALPADMISSFSYYYTTDATGTYYKLYARLENDQDEGAGVYPDGYVGTVCGSSLECTYGIASTNATPL